MPTPFDNLPQQLTTFIGRDREVAEVRRLLTERRIVTLSGAGGIGKTRLALEVARRTTELFPDGVWLVELATLSEPEAVPQAVAAALGVREETDRDLLSILADYVLQRKLLLVLDNCEHLVAACAQLANLLLRIAPDLRILATSRQALGLDGECVSNVPPMALPGPTAPVSPQNDPNSEAEAIRLFVDRVRLRKPDFTLSSSNLPSVAALCARLDGLPLAIELAAARVRALSVDQLLEHLDARFQLLASPAASSGTVEPRHQTLTGLMDWSYDLLPAREQQLFREMSVFSGGCTLEAVKEVCGASGEEWETVELITQLADKSLLIVEERDDRVRYRLLETIRQYAWEKLRESGHAEELRGRHLGYYLQLAEQSQDELLRERQQAWLERLEIEHDNLRAALIWSRVGGVDAAIGLRLAGALVWFWYFRGYLTEGRTELEAALQNAWEAAEAGGPAGAESLESHAALTGPEMAEWAKTLTAAGTLAFLQGDYTIARTRLEGGLRTWRQLGDKRGTAFALTFLARVSKRQGAAAAAKLMGEEGVVLFREVDERWGLALSLDFLGEVARDAHDETEAIALHNESLSLYESLGHRWGVALELSSFGQAAMQRGDYAEARKRLEEAVAIQREVGDRWSLAWTLRSLASVLQFEGDAQRAKTLYEESLAIFHEIGDRAGAASTARDLSSAESPDAQSAGLMQSPPRARAAIEAANVGELTRREVEVLKLVAEGLTDVQIAARLYLSARTVQAHVRSIYSKVGVNTRSAATRYALEQGLI